jgi:4-amino-4-deoxy-L-arabinose transferase-like glycosyltransferase
VQRKRPTRPGLGTRLLSIPYGDLVRRVPRVAWICALVGCLNAIGWSILTPPFQVPDEPDHFAYVKQLAETGSLPRSNGRETSSAEEVSTLVAIHYFNVRQQPQHHTIASRAEQHTLESELASLRRDQGSTEAGVAVSQPPLYYALEAIPYSLAHSGTVLDRLQLMRLLSALFAGLTAMFVFLFIRETLPGTPWAWTVGGLSVALAPLLGFMSGAVNPDSMLAAVSAAIFYCLARAFRRGLTTRSAATIGLVSAIGLLTKLNFVGLLPGVLLGLLVLSVRAARVSGRSAYLLLALGAGIAFSPAVLYAAINGLSHHPVLGIVSATINTTHSSMLAELNYIWQFYLPRLPGTVNDFPGLFTTRQLWFNDYVGLYGWLDTTFPSWVDNLALIPAGALVLLCGGSLIRERDALRGRWAEVAVYAVIAVGLLMLIGADSYRTFPRSDAEFAQPRYLLPLLALLGAALALAARGAGRRWGPVAGALIVVLFLAHDIFSQLLTAGRFYG